MFGFRAAGDRANVNENRDTTASQRLSIAFQ
jgi:hypothetical protein